MFKALDQVDADLRQMASGHKFLSELSYAEMISTDYDESRKIHNALCMKYGKTSMMVFAPTKCIGCDIESKHPGTREGFGKHTCSEKVGYGKIYDHSIQTRKISRLEEKISSFRKITNISSELEISSKDFLDKIKTHQEDARNDLREKLEAGMAEELSNVRSELEKMKTISDPMEERYEDLRRQARDAAHVHQDLQEANKRARNKLAHKRSMLPYLPLVKNDNFWSQCVFEKMIVKLEALIIRYDKEIDIPKHPESAVDTAAFMFQLIGFEIQCVKHKSRGLRAWNLMKDVIQEKTPKPEIALRYASLWDRWIVLENKIPQLREDNRWALKATGREEEYELHANSLLRRNSMLHTEGHL